MNRLERRSRADRVLAGYFSGPEATRRAADAALVRARAARMVILVEGISDLIALEAVAQRQGRDLHAERIVVVPVGGAHALAQHVSQFREEAVEVRCLIDEAERELLRGAFSSAGGDATGLYLEGVGVYVCVEDLEDELVRAVGPSLVEKILEREGDLGSFRTLQRQPAWRAGDLTAQLRRFFGAGARRKLRYARLLILALDPDQVPGPLVGVLKVGPPAVTLTPAPGRLPRSP